MMILDFKFEPIGKHLNSNPPFIFILRPSSSGIPGFLRRDFRLTLRAVTALNFSNPQIRVTFRVRVRVRVGVGVAV